MPERLLKPRKQPQQERSRRMQARILQAAVRVLAEEGALGFTTTAVADEAGISVGSLYQYFPNKHALVLALHHDAIERGWEHVQAILDDPARGPRQKVADIAAWFFATESEESQRIGPLLDEIGVFVRHDPGDPLEEEVHRRFSDFAAASGRPGDAGFAADLLITTLEATGKAIASRTLTRAERQRWASSTAAMLCDYLGIQDPAAAPEDRGHAATSHP